MWTQKTENVDHKKDRAKVAKKEEDRKRLNREQKSCYVHAQEEPEETEREEESSKINTEENAYESNE